MSSDIPPGLQIHTSLRYDPLLLQAHSNPSFTHAGWNYSHLSPYYMLPFHRDRILRAAVHFGWEPAISLLTGDEGLSNLTNFIETELDKEELEKTKPLKLKITINKQGRLDLGAAPLPPLSLRDLFPSEFSVPSSLGSSSSPVRDDAAESGSEGPPKGAPYKGKGEDCWVITLDKTATDPSEYTHFKTSHRSMYDTARQRAHIETYTTKEEVLLVNETDNSIMEGSITTPYLFRDGKWVTPPVKSVYLPKGDSGGNDGTSRRWALESGLASEQVVFADSLKDGEECWLSNGARGFFFGRIKL